MPDIFSRKGFEEMVRAAEKQIKQAVERTGEWLNGEYNRPEQLIELLGAAINRVEDGLAVQTPEFKNKPCRETGDELALYTSGIMEVVAEAFPKYFGSEKARQTERVRMKYQEFTRAYASRPTRDLPDLLRQLQADIQKIANQDKSYRETRRY